MNVVLRKIHGGDASGTVRATHGLENREIKLQGCTVCAQPFCAMRSFIMTVRLTSRTLKPHVDF
jgi:hypothetical protein